MGRRRTRKWNAAAGMSLGAFMKIRLLSLAALLISGLATAGDISPVVGHYRYKDYAATLADGRVIKLQDMGATDAFLDISEDGVITLRMTMAAGNSVVQSAKVLEGHFDAGKGSGGR